MCTWLRTATSIVGTHVKAFKALHELGGRQEHLRSLVSELPALLRREFGRRGIPAWLAFVPQELNNLHANLGWESRRLTDAQWLLLQETFLSLHVELDSSRKYRRRKPWPADRLLFEGILWKLASGLHWQDLPEDYPVRLCQDLYSALYRTGHLQAIYKQLHWHLNVYGEATLDELVERGCFVITGNRVQLSPSEDLTWEKYTALFLLQQAYHARRAIQREADRDRRRRGNFFRQPALRLPRFPRRRIGGVVPGPGPAAYGSETVCQTKPPPHLEGLFLERKFPAKEPGDL
jgi:transposase